MTQNDVVDTPGNAGKEAPRVAPTIAYTIRSVNKGTWQLVIMKIHFLQRNTESQNHSLFPMNSTNPTQIFVNVFFNIGVTLMSRKTAGDHIQLASETKRRSFAPPLSLTQTFHILLGHRRGCLVKGRRQRRWKNAPEVDKRKTNNQEDSILSLQVVNREYLSYMFN